MQKHVVFIWELGDNFGHIAMFSGLARELHARGMQLTAILQNLADAPAFFKDIPIQLLQAPTWKKPGAPIRPQNYTDDIRNCGYSNAQGLQGLLRGWQSLYTLLKPDLVIFNSAPTAMAAAKDEKFKKVSIGHGYEIPPQQEPMPFFRPSDKADAVAITAREKEMLKVLNSALKAVDISPCKHFFELFNVDKEFLSCVPELDHYPQRKKGDYIGAVSNVDGGTKVEWPESGGKKIFAYIRPESRSFAPLMQALHGLSRAHSIVVSAPNISQKNIETLTTPGMRIIPTAAHIASLRKQCDLAICHAGIGTIGAFLLAGVPLLLLPNHVEQWMMAQCVLRIGAGAMPKDNANMQLMQQAVLAMLATPSFKERAQLYAKKYAAFKPEKVNDYLVGEIVKLLEDKKVKVAAKVAKTKNNVAKKKPTGSATKTPRSRSK